MPPNARVNDYPAAAAIAAVVMSVNHCFFSLSRITRMGSVTGVFRFDENDHGDEGERERDFRRKSGERKDRVLLRRLLMPSDE